MTLTSTDPAVEVGVVIQSLLFRKRITQGEVATALGIGQSTVSAKLRGKVAISISELYAIAQLLEVEPATLLPRLDSNQRPFD